VPSENWKMLLKSLLPVPVNKTNLRHVNVTLAHTLIHAAMSASVRACGETAVSD
jgi:hypothetical protein